jgi:hypothetical protein
MEVREEGQVERPLAPPGFQSSRFQEGGIMLTTRFEPASLSILGALTLSLDFVNLFPMLLRLLGRRK